MRIRLRQRARYRFDNWMARGLGAQIALLAVATLALIVAAAAALVACGGGPEPGQSFAAYVWASTMHTLDAGVVAEDDGSGIYLAIMLAITAGGIFVVSALIGIINNAVGSLIENLRRGRSIAVERGHTVILGWSPKIQTILHELGVAGENQRDPCVVIVAARDKVAMDLDVRAGETGRLRVVTRSGNPMSLQDLAMASLATSKSIIVLAPEALPPHEADACVLKTLLAVVKRAGRAVHIVAELQQPATEAVARMIAGPSAALVVTPPLISRLLVQTGRQSGLSVVYTELLDFDGVEIYIQPEPALAHRRFRDAVLAYDDSTLLGILTAGGALLLPPPLDYRIEPGDQVIAISEDDDTVQLNGRPVELGAELLAVAPRRTVIQRERTLVLGASDRLDIVLRELDAYVAAGSQTLVVGERTAPVPMLARMAVAQRAGDITDRALLEELDVGSFDHILVLSELHDRTQDMADARTIIALLHLRDLLRRAGRAVPIISEILDVENRELAAVAEADDFIVSNTLVALLLAQVSENRHLVRVFEDLFSAGGFEVSLKPADEYVPREVELPFQAVVEAALLRGELAIGIRCAAAAGDAEQDFGVIVNPSKQALVQFARGDQVIVLADG